MCVNECVYARERVWGVSACAWVCEWIVHVSVCQCTWVCERVYMSVHMKESVGWWEYVCERDHMSVCECVWECVFVCESECMCLHVGPRGHCFCFLLLLQQDDAYLVAWSNTDLLSYISEGQGSKMGLTGLKSRCQWSCIPSGDSRGEFVPCLFQAPEAAHVSWFVALLPSPKPAMAESFSHRVFWPILLPLLPLLRILVITLGPPGNSV